MRAAVLALLLAATPAATEPAHRSCRIIGDSIALGLQAWAMPHCAVAARTSINTAAYAAGYRADVSEALAVVSLGSNDGWANWAGLAQVRARLHGRVVWLIPSISTPARFAVARFAAASGDAAIDLARFTGPGVAHPALAGYRAIAAELARLEGGGR